MIGSAISLVIQLVALMIRLTVMALRLMIRGSIWLVAAIAALLEERRRTKS